MHASSRRQKQTLSLLKFRRLASSTIRPPLSLAQTNRKRFAIISLGLVAGIGIPGFAFASQQHLFSPVAPDIEASQAPSVSPDPTSSDAEGVFSSPGETETNTSTTSTSVSASSTPDGNTSSSVTIDGETIPLTNGSVSKHVVNDDGSVVDIDVTIENSSSSSSNSSTSTDITIDSNSSSTSNQNTNRGSPRR